MIKQRLQGLNIYNIREGRKNLKRLWKTTNGWKPCKDVNSPCRQSPASYPGKKECSRPCPRANRALPCRRTCSNPRRHRPGWCRVRRPCPATPPWTPRRGRSLAEGSRTRPCPAGASWCKNRWDAARRLRTSTSRRPWARPRPWLAIPKKWNQAATWMLIRKGRRIY